MKGLVLFCVGYISEKYGIFIISRAQNVCVFHLQIGMREELDVQKQTRNFEETILSVLFSHTGKCHGDRCKSVLKCNSF